MRELINIVEATMATKQPGNLVQLNPAGIQAMSEPFITAGIDPTAIFEFTGPVKGAPLVIYPGDEENIVARFNLKDPDGNPFVLAGSSPLRFNKIFVNVRGSLGDESSITNRGEVSEGILAAAMFAKFIAREGDGDIGTVNAGSIIAALNSLNKTGEEEYTVSSKDSDNKHADKITLTVKLKAAPYGELMDPGKRPALIKEYAAAVSYVNSSSAERYSRYFYLNGRADHIEIISDGTSDEAGRKTDVWVQIKDPKTGQPRKLRLDVSLKAGPVKQFGQVYGSQWESMVKLWDFFNIDVTAYEGPYKKNLAKDPQSAIAFMYKNVAKEINNKILTADPAAEAAFTDDLAHAIEYFTTLGDKNIEMVHFDKGGFEVLRFGNLKSKFKEIDLEAMYINDKARPQIDIVDPNTSKVLVTIRAKIENNDTGGAPRIRNIIEKGPLLSELAKVDRAPEMSNKERKEHIANVQADIAAGGVSVGPSAGKKQALAKFNAKTGGRSAEQAAGRSRR